MKVRKIAVGAVFGGAVLAAMLGAGAAQADSSNGNGAEAVGANPSASDTQGFGNVNHMKGDGVNGWGAQDGYNEGKNGIGSYRSSATGDQVSDQSGTTRVVSADSNTRDYQIADRAAAGTTLAPGQAAKVYPQDGNKVTPKK